ncbi:MAG: C39 family peptidase [Nitrospira sp.]|nr:C39 family peptidase [Nitrospira sp.]
MQKRAWLALAVLASTMMVSSPSWGTFPFPLPGGTTMITAPVTSFVKLRYKNMVRQSNDVSCGAAALATILDYFYDETVTEESLMDGIMQMLPNLNEKDKIEKEGFSLLELKRYAEKLGYVSNGYRLDGVQRLAQLPVPVIALVNVRGYNHFVVIKGVMEGQVYLADPAFGNSTRPVEGFGQEWNGIVLVILHPTKEGNSTFAMDARPTAPRNQVLSIVERLTPVLRPGPGEF